MTQTTETKVNAFVADAQVQFESSPVVTVRLTIEPTNEPTNNQRTERQGRIHNECDRLFGTDGIRGVAGVSPLDPATAFAVGVALARWIGTNHLDPEVAIGIDTRESGTWLAEHVAGGMEREGVRARFAGLIPTPGIAHVARTGPFAAGVMISASHNPYRDNGIKIIAIR